MSNVLLLIIDDAGIEQLSCYNDQNQFTDPLGYPYAYTPNIDRLAASGVRFNQYRSTPVCSPARASILTGRYSFENAVGYAIKDRVEISQFKEFNTPPGPVFLTLPEAFHGFSFAVGKWHLGVDQANSGTMDLHPNTIGFDQWSGTPRNIDVGGPPATSGYPSSYYNFWWVDNQVRYQSVGKHASELTADRTIEFINNASGQWFGYVAFNAPHAPFLLPTEHHGFGSSVPSGQKNTRFRAMLENLDYHIGRILDVVDNDTYVILVGDNGTTNSVININPLEVRYPIGHPLHTAGDETTPFSSAPYDPSRFKQTVYEGGVRCPLLVSGPGISSGTRDQLVDVVDLYPTIARCLYTFVPRTNALPFNRFLKQDHNHDLRKFSTCQFFAPNGIMPFDQYEFYSAYYIDLKNQDRFKLIHSITSGVNSYQFYNVTVDPLELNPLPCSGVQFDQTLAAYTGLVY